MARRRASAIFACSVALSFAACAASGSRSARAPACAIRRRVRRACGPRPTRAAARRAARRARRRRVVAGCARCSASAAAASCRSCARSSASFSPRRAAAKASTSWPRSPAKASSRGHCRAPSAFFDSRYAAAVWQSWFARISAAAEIRASSAAADDHGRDARYPPPRAADGGPRLLHRRRLLVQRRVHQFCCSHRRHLRLHRPVERRHLRDADAGHGRQGQVRIPRRLSVHDELGRQRAVRQRVVAVHHARLGVRRRVPELGPQLCGRARHLVVARRPVREAVPPLRRHVARGDALARPGGRVGRLLHREEGGGDRKASCGP